MIRLLLLAGACYLSYRMGQESGMRMAQSGGDDAGRSGGSSAWRGEGAGSQGDWRGEGAGTQGGSVQRSARDGASGTDAEVMTPAIITTAG